MKIPKITGLKRGLGITIAAGTVLFALPTPKALAESKPDTFEYVAQTPQNTVQIDSAAYIPPSGTDNEIVLKNAPLPYVKIMGERHIAVFVVDISKNVLYQYNKDGEPIKAYLVASGRPSSPTHTGVRIVSQVETYPYSSAPLGTKRRKYPADYGPKIIHLKRINTKTGNTIDDGEYIHGNRNINSLGKYASKGCVRMDNEVIRQLSKEVEKGDVIIFKR